MTYYEVDKTSDNRKGKAMERVLTQEERIRRAEEIYLRRRNLEVPQYKVQNRADKSSAIKSVKLFKRIFLQIIICLLLYCIFYLIYDTNFSFSDITISKTQEILNYDINVEEMYKNISTYVNALMQKENSTENNNEDIQEQPQENVDDTGNQEQQVTEAKNEANVENQTSPVVEETIQQGEVLQEIQPTVAEEVSLKQLYSLIVPVNGGYISSEFGERESTSEIVSTNHKGIDIAAATRNKHCSCNWRNSNNVNFF